MGESFMNTRRPDLKKFAEIELGMELPEVKKQVTQEIINKYAQASGDMDPQHIDPEFAGQTVFKGTIAHGLLTIAYISEMMANFFNDGWYSGSAMEISFHAPVRPGDTITVSGKVNTKKASGDRGIVTCKVACTNQENASIITGTATALAKL
ncbi:MAG TPA: acyl dehydratase [Desulfotomaculum sp.]|nr:acyl dehydratase [Desulfotomaculum sp.]HBY04326.1 acyl dehydratase [Desulfotomaculum sp.]